MGMVNGDIEKTAESVYRDAGLQADKPADPADLVRRILGADSIRMVPPRAIPGLGAVARIGSRWSVFLVEGAPLVRQRFVLLHELAHVVLGRGAGEDRCDALAAALLAPCAAFRSVYASTGLELPALADRFGATEACVALRLGEVTQQPTLLFGGGAQIRRGRAYSWPGQRALQRLASETIEMPGLRKARLCDGSERVLLTVAV